MRVLPSSFSFAAISAWPSAYADAASADATRHAAIVVNLVIGMNLPGRTRRQSRIRRHPTINSFVGAAQRACATTAPGAATAALRPFSRVLAGAGAVAGAGARA